MRSRQASLARRRSNALLAALLAAALLAGCAAEVPAEAIAPASTVETPPTPRPAETVEDVSVEEVEVGTAEEAPAWPRVVEGAKGRATLYRPPQRLALLDPGFQDPVVALGERPWASTWEAKGKRSAYLMEETKGAQWIGISHDVHVASLDRAEADLAVGMATFVQEAAYDDLSKATFTLLLQSPAAGDWETTLHAFGRIYGKEALAQDLVAEHDRRVASLRERMGAERAGESVAVLIYLQHDLLGWAGPSHPIGRVVHGDLGLATPPSLAASTGPQNLERADVVQLDADHLVLVMPSGHVRDVLLEELRSTEGWNATRAVEAGHVHVVEETLWLRVSGPLGAHQRLDDLEAALLPERSAEA